VSTEINKFLSYVLMHQPEDGLGPTRWLPALSTPTLARWATPRIARVSAAICFRKCC